MKTLIVSIGQHALASLLLTVLCGVGCTTWQASPNRPPETSPRDSLRPPSETRRPFGVNAKSRDIERSLGIQ